jgi:hypothetical protein
MLDVEKIGVILSKKLLSQSCAIESGLSEPADSGFE